jgi:hypothetical protein
MNIDLEQLKQAAQVAVPGPWHVNGGSDVVLSDDFSFWASDNDTANFIAAANPDVVLELIERLEYAEAIVRKEMPPIAQCPKCYACFDAREQYGGELK